MANNCFYDLSVIGARESVLRFRDILLGKDTIKLWRVWKEDVDYEFHDNGNRLTANGDCAWCIDASFNSDGMYCPNGKPIKNPNMTDDVHNLSQISKELNLKIEIWGEEGMCMIWEHYLYDSGKEVLANTDRKS